MGRFSIESTMKEAPPRVLVYGPGGIGKSTFGAAAPRTVFICAEDGLRNIDAMAVKPFPQTWPEILEALEELRSTDCDGVAVDSLDWAEPLCWAHVCEKAKKKDIEAFGYGKGYVAALDEWRILLHKLSAIHASGKRVILIAHAARKTFKNPLGEDFEHWTIKLHDKAAGLIVEWCDVVGFAEQETSTVETSEKSGRFKAMTTGRRVLRTQPSPSFLAKTRYALPKAIPLEWKSFEAQLEMNGPAAVERLRAELDAKLLELKDEEAVAGCRAFLRSRGVSVASLNEAIETVNAYLAEKVAS